VKRILGLIILFLIAFGVIRISTFGWRFWRKLDLSAEKENLQLVEKLKRHVYKLAHEIGDRSIFRYEKLIDAERYITEQFQSFGYKVEFQEYTLYNKPVKNIIVTKIGRQRPEEIIILGAHYDTCGNPGADDNASAVAGLLEIARFISDKQTNSSLKFIAFVNEEPPFFKTENMGSRVYIRAAKESREDIKATLILEMIGYYTDKLYSQRYPPIFGMFHPNRGNFIAVVGNFPSRWLVKEVISNFKKETQFPIRSVITFSSIAGVDFSDHWSFWQEGYPAVMITDTSFYRNLNYHTSSDTYETLNYENMAEVVKGLSAALIELTN